MWVYPDERYYYDWYGRENPNRLSDAEIKSAIVSRLKDDPYTADLDIKVDVKQHVVILGGQAPSSIAKRVAGDDAWDTPGVVDVSNQLEVVAGPRE
jgi:osmotically-inducible protein OsmY